jgi:predicted glycoside hydrolase/deacetylase ChbG (UPF0249 family)
VRGRGTTATGALIVNADDLGRDEATTDAILACFRGGGITDASAMVFMRDSARSAAAARDAWLPVGLHLNLTEPFTDPATPEPVRGRQARLAAYFRARRARHWLFHPRLSRCVEAAVAEQIAAFESLHGRAPTHVDGHWHIHECPNVILSPALAAGTRVRRSFTFRRGQKSAANRAVRAALNGVMDCRFRSTRYFFDLRDLHPRLGGAGLDELLALAGRTTVEVMVHPAYADEYALLTGEEWRRTLDRAEVGSWEAV